MRAGVVVAGGRSTRFGEADKAVADLTGVPMIRRVADRLGETVDALVVNCRHDQAPAIREALAGVDVPVEIAEDERPDRGPAAGIRAGLRRVPAEYAAVVACDAPFVDPDFVDYLFARVRDRDGAPADAAVPRVDGRLQPLLAVYRTEAAIDTCGATLARGDRSVTAALSELDCVVVGETECRDRAAPGTFENLNTRAEFEAAAERLRSGARE